MTNEDRNLLRAQLLIEAADLLDEGYNKPNSNDRIATAKQRKLDKERLDNIKDKFKEALRDKDYTKANEMRNKMREYENSIDEKTISRMRATSKPGYASETYRTIKTEKPIYTNYDYMNGNLGFVKQPSGVKILDNKSIRDRDREHRGDSEDPLANKKPGLYKRLAK